MATEVFRRTRDAARVVVVFESTRDLQRPEFGDTYEVTAEQLMELVQAMPGFVDVESVRGADGRGITVSYWESREAIAHWKANAIHTAARARGRDEWYASFRITVAHIEQSAAAFAFELKPVAFRVTQLSSVWCVTSRGRGSMTDEKRVLAQERDIPGPGIAAEDIPHSFPRYWQSTRSRGGGVELGLFIAERLVALHGRRTGA